MSGTPRTGSQLEPPQPTAGGSRDHHPRARTEDDHSDVEPAAGHRPASSPPRGSRPARTRGTPRPPAHRTPAGPPALLVEHVTKRFNVDRRKPPVLAIDDVSLRLERGTIHGILGANGSGKSTLIRLISGLLTLDEGRVEVFGLDIERDELAVKRLINRVSVDAAFFKKLSPMENLLFAARLYGLDGREAKRRGDGDPRPARHRGEPPRPPVEQMSRGMQQKVAIARALLTSPTLLLLDEPTTGLDPRSKLDVQAFVEEVNAEHGATIVLTTHDLAEAERLCSRITILDGGRVVAEDTPEGLKRLVAERHGQEPTLHAVFMTFTGRSLDEDVEEDDDEPD